MMPGKKLLVLLPLIVSLFCSYLSHDAEPWKHNQLMQPADLAAVINHSTAIQPLIISVGPGALIQGSVDIGPAKDTANLTRLRQLLATEKKGREIVIYCGCCPFEHCPNVRPAFSLLNELKFTHHKLLNLEHNIRVDWVNKGYPSTGKS
jgi:thiosulfate/3-mercaptopyruvate sulfurtransferase